jgi:glutaredoxin
MDFEKPTKEGFTVYSKSGCPNCMKVKNLLKEKDIFFTIIDCDEYILEDKENFLIFMKNISNDSVKLFPYVFNNEKYIGNLKETKEYFNNLLIFDEDF